MLYLITGERPYACEVPGCNKSFTEYSSLYKHNVVHTQQKPYICNICHKTYRQTSTLAMHKRTVHGTSEEGLNENGNKFSLYVIKLRLNSAKSDLQGVYGNCLT